MSRPAVAGSIPGRRGVGVAVVAGGARQCGSSSGSFAVDEQAHAVAGSVPGIAPVLGSPSSHVVPGNAVPVAVPSQSMSQVSDHRLQEASQESPPVLVAVVAGVPGSAVPPAIPSQSMRQTRSCRKHPSCRPPVLGSPSSQAVPGSAVPPAIPSQSMS